MSREKSSQPSRSLTRRSARQLDIRRSIWEMIVAFYNYPKEHWKHLRTTNPVESPFASLRLRTDGAAKCYKGVDRAIAVIWKMLMVVEQRFRRLNAPDMMKAVYDGQRYEDGAVTLATEEVAA